MATAAAMRENLILNQDSVSTFVSDLSQEQETGPSLDNHENGLGCVLPRQPTLVQLRRSTSNASSSSAIVSVASEDEDLARVLNVAPSNRSQQQTTLQPDPPVAEGAAATAEVPGRHPSTTKSSTTLTTHEMDYGGYGTDDESRVSARSLIRRSSIQNRRLLQQSPHGQQQQAYNGLIVKDSGKARQNDNDDDDDDESSISDDISLGNGDEDDEEEEDDDEEEENDDDDDEEEEEEEEEEITTNADPLGGGEGGGETRAFGYGAAPKHRGVLRTMTSDSVELSRSRHAPPPGPSNNNNAAATRAVASGATSMSKPAVRRGRRRGDTATEESAQEQQQQQAPRAAPVRRGVCRFDTTNSIDLAHGAGHDDEDDDDEDDDQPPAAQQIPATTSRVAPERRGVCRTETSDSLVHGSSCSSAGSSSGRGGDKSRPQRRGGRRTFSGQNDEDHEEDDNDQERQSEANTARVAPERRGVCRTETSDSLVHGSSCSSAGSSSGRGGDKSRPQRRGGRRTSSGDDNQEDRGGHRTETTVSIEFANGTGPPSPRRGVQRMDTTNSIDLKLGAVAAAAATTPSHRRGGRRGGGEANASHLEVQRYDSDPPSNQQLSQPPVPEPRINRTMAPVSRGVSRFDTANSVDLGQAAKKMRNMDSAGREIRRGGRRNDRQTEDQDPEQDLESDGEDEDGYLPQAIRSTNSSGSLGFVHRITSRRGSTGVLMPIEHNPSREGYEFASPMGPIGRRASTGCGASPVMTIAAPTASNYACSNKMGRRFSAGCNFGSALDSVVYMDAPPSPPMQPRIMGRRASTGGGYGYGMEPSSLDLPGAYPQIPPSPPAQIKTVVMGRRASTGCSMSTVQTMKRNTFPPNTVSSGGAYGGEASRQQQDESDDDEDDMDYGYGCGGGKCSPQHAYGYGVSSVQQISIKRATNEKGITSAAELMAGGRTRDAARKKEPGDDDESDDDESTVAYSDKERPHIPHGMYNGDNDLGSASDSERSQSTTTSRRSARRRNSVLVHADSGSLFDAAEAAAKASAIVLLQDGLKTSPCSGENADQPPEPLLSGKSTEEKQGETPATGGGPQSSSKNISAEPRPTHYIRKEDDSWNRSTSSFPTSNVTLTKKALAESQKAMLPGDKGKVNNWGDIAIQSSEDSSSDSGDKFGESLYKESAALQEFDRYKQRPRRRESLDKTRYNMKELYADPKEHATLPKFKPADQCHDASDFVVRAFAARLRRGTTVIKHNRSRWSKSQPRDIFLMPDGKTLSWKPIDGEADEKGSKRPRLDLSKCIEVRHASSRDPDTKKQLGTMILRKRCKEGTAGKSFSLIFPKRTLDVTCLSSDSCKMLMEGFSAICFRLQREKLMEAAESGGPGHDPSTNVGSDHDDDDWASTVYGESTASITQSNTHTNNSHPQNNVPWGV